jgi:hypothetical protein
MALVADSLRAPALRRFRRCLRAAVVEVLQQDLPGMLGS